MEGHVWIGEPPPSSSPGPRNISGLEVAERVAACCNVLREISAAMTPNVTLLHAPIMPEMRGRMYSSVYSVCRWCTPSQRLLS